MTPSAHTPTAAPLALAEGDRLADEIAEVASLIDAATHRLLALIRRFDEGSGWAQHGALSCAHWLSWRIGLDMGAARERVRVARALGTLPLLDDTLRRGAISYAKARAITRVATPTNEATLVEMAQHATGAQLERICRGYRRVRTSLDSEGPQSPADEALRRFVHTSDTDDGMVRVEARLRPEEAALLMQAIDVARRAAWRQKTPTDVSAETPPPALARADALVLLAETCLSSAARDGAARVELAAPVELVVHVDEAALTVDAAEADALSIGGAPDQTRHHATLADGTAITIATAQRLACGAAVVRVVEDANGDVRTLTRRTRRISTTLRRALRVRDDGCRFPGCTNRITDAHHVHAWARGGATTLANLCSLCRRHHRIVHEHRARGGWRAALLPPRRLGGSDLRRPTAARPRCSGSASEGERRSRHRHRREHGVPPLGRNAGGLLDRGRLAARARAARRHRDVMHQPQKIPVGSAPTSSSSFANVGDSGNGS